MPVFYLGIPNNQSQQDKDQAVEFFLQDQDQFFIFDVMVSETKMMILAYYLNSKNEKILLGKYSPYSTENFVNDRNNLYARLGKTKQPRLFTGSNPSVAT